MATTFSPNEKTYAVVITTAQVLKRADPDNIAIWSVHPFDATTRTDWPQIDSAFKAIARKETVVEVVTQQDVAVASGALTVIQ
jgi:hypothetical protein